AVPAIVHPIPVVAAPVTMAERTAPPSTVVEDHVAEERRTVIAAIIGAVATAGAHAEAFRQPLRPDAVATGWRRDRALGPVRGPHRAATNERAMGSVRDARVPCPNRHRQRRSDVQRRFGTVARGPGDTRG